MVIGKRFGTAFVLCLAVGGASAQDGLQSVRPARITPAQAAGLVPIGDEPARFSGVTASKAAPADRTPVARRPSRITPAQAAGLVSVGGEPAPLPNEPRPVRRDSSRVRPTSVPVAYESYAAPLPMAPPATIPNYAPAPTYSPAPSYSSAPVSAAPAVRCNCPECRDASTWDRFHDSVESEKRDLRRDHYTWSFDHYRHLNHPECPPHCSPSWGYHQTCWRRFPEETLWCPGCPPSPVPLPAPMQVSPTLPPPVPAAPPADAFE